MFTAVFTMAALAQTPGTPLDSRLTIHTIVREDVFAGFMANDKDRQARAAANIELLLAERPDDRAPLTAWKGAIALNRAVDAYESKRTADFDREYRQALGLFSEARREGATNPGVLAVSGGIYAVFADRLPEPQRTAAWITSYEAYRALYKVQEGAVEKFPLHMKGELLGGLAQAAQRTEHKEESAALLTRIVQTMPDTPYAVTAQKWIDNPDAAAKTKIVCQTCHEPGRLEARKAALK